jgi:lipopolysaccharide transport system ATP-binding protein
MSEIAISVNNLSKKYYIGQYQRYKTLRDTLTDAMYTSFHRLLQLMNGQSTINNHQSSNTIWALKDVSFEVKHGEVVGIIGPNGAGKSTLLKILTRITEPTEGYADIYGRVGSLLEVGTGFHPELTGRENVYLSGAILGMKKVEIDRKFDEIVAFAEIEKFLDTPVKRYSSGMHVRLGFAVAAHLEPEILLVDEVLAVGDAAFQKKCLGKMGEVSKQGRTVLFVSHNLIAIETLCQRVIWLRDGKTALEGNASQVISNYLRTSFSNITEKCWDDIAAAPGNDEVRLLRACARPINESPNEPINVCKPFVMEFEYWNLKPNAYINLSLQLYNEQGILVFESAPVNEPTWQGHPFPVGLFRDICYVPGNLLNNGIHRVVLFVVKDQGKVIHKEDNILVFEVQDAVENRAGWSGGWDGAVRPILKWRTELIKPDIPNSV